MSTSNPDTPRLNLLIPSSNQVTKQAMAFRRADGGRALDAPRACVLHEPCARAAASRPALTPARDRPQPARRVPLRATRSALTATRKADTPASPGSQGLAATAARQPYSGRRRPSLPRSPPVSWSSASSSAASSSSARRHHVALATARRFADKLIRGHGNRPRRAL